MTLSPQVALTIGAIVAPALFIIAVYLTRASVLRAIAALAAAIAFGVANVLWDRAAFQLGWWSYPAFAGARLVWLVYLPSGLVAGGAFGLLGWRVVRQYGARGLATFLALWSLWGLIHDYGGALLFRDSNLMRFGPGMLPVLADVALYASCGAIAQLVLRIVGGPFNADPLARSGSS